MCHTLRVRQQKPVCLAFCDVFVFRTGFRGCVANPDTSPKMCSEKVHLYFTMNHAIRLYAFHGARLRFVYDRNRVYP